MAAGNPRDRVHIEAGRETSPLLETKMRKLAIAAATAAALGFGTPAGAATETFSFGDILSAGGSGPWVDPDAGAAWGTLSVTTQLANKYLFTLTLNSNFGSIFGSGAYVGSALFNSTSGIDPSSTAITGSGNGVAAVAGSNSAAQVGSVAFDFSDCFGSAGNCNNANTASARLKSGEHVSWIATFNSSQGDPFSFGSPAAALHVQGLSVLGGSAWYTPVSAIPEPETYAMLLAGLGLLGFVARRRQKKVLAA